MEPVTIAGLALGIAPLIISAVENYETTFQPFVTYGRYSREIDRFKTRLSTQKAIFNNECQLLLSAVENKDTQIGLFISNQTQCRLSQTDRDDVSKKLLDNLIAASIKAYTQKLHLIKNTLGAISRETNGFEKVVVDLASKVGLDSNIFPSAISGCSSCRPGDERIFLYSIILVILAVKTRK